MVGDFQQLGVGLVSLTDAINTTSAQGRLVFNLFASLAEFERELIRERTHAGLAVARARVGGRQRGLSEQAERTAIIAETLYREQQLGVNEIAQRLNCLVRLFVDSNKARDPLGFSGGAFCLLMDLIRG